MDLSSQKQTNLNRLIFFQEEILWKGFWAPVSCLWQSCGELPVRSPAYRDQGAVSIRKTVLPGMAIPMLKIRRPNGRLIFNMEIAIRR